MDNWQAASGKKRIDWQTEAAPDLVIEVDITSYTDVNDFLAYQVPEVWLFRSDRITIYQLQNDNYTVSDRSCYFPDLDILGLLAECFEVAEN
ncbi:MAG: Uma2 family endonuclease, partial [Cyanobacteria bacterium J06633_1]